MSELSKIFFPKKFLGISVKYFIAVQIVIILGFTVFWMKDAIKYSNQSKILEEKLYKAELKGEIIKVEKNHGTALFSLDNDTNKYVIGFACNENYSPPYLINYIKKGSHISKKENTNTLLIDSVYVFQLFSTIKRTVP